MSVMTVEPSLSQFPIAWLVHHKHVLNFDGAILSKSYNSFQPEYWLHHTVGSPLRLRVACCSFYGSAIVPHYSKLLGSHPLLDIPGMSRHVYGDLK